MFSGTVIEVIEGDLFKVRTQDWGDYMIRLWGVDAPEMDQSVGRTAKDHLKSIILKKTVTGDVFDQEKGAKRILFGWVKVGDPRKFDIVNELMVAAGLAWCEPIVGNGEVKDTIDFLRKSEQQARKTKAGLWSTPNPIAPWEWRKRGMGSAGTLVSNLLEQVREPPDDASERQRFIRARP